MKRILPLALAAAASMACGAPRAAPISGDIASVLERGMSEGRSSFDHGTWDDLLQRHVKASGRRFDYAGLKAESASFESYLSAIAGADLTALSATEIQALLINAYNAYTIKTVLDRVTPDGRYEIESIQDVSNVFGREAHEVGGFVLSLDNIEHNILRPMFKDPRFHFAVNCASISCPPLPGRAFTGEDLDAELEDATRKAIQNPDYVSVEADGLLVTKILDWYGGDFVNPDFKGSKGSLAEFLRGYATEEVATLIDEAGTALSIEFRGYEWGLNKP